ncbi:MAG: hypothetical protein V5B31_07365 [Candidatus Accumulibacter propinquus]|jgi:hypothetical protein|uniref:hypothetical protein n=1 Tax=Candidatus Accumulibacter propinquus TaxID=2954380 RepID=UPI002FC2D580
MQTSFADAILNIAVTGPLVRIDFGTATAVTNAEGRQEVRLNPSQQVVMPMEGFVRAFDAQERLMKQLIADGVLKVQAPPSDGVGSG